MSIIESLTGYDKNESDAWKKGYWEGVRLVLLMFLPIWALIASCILIVLSI